MVFFGNLIFSMFYCEYISRYKKFFKNYPEWILFTPILILWTLICGSQYNVGTDYFSYMSIFSGEKLEYYESGGEIGFVYFIKFFNSIGIRGQGIYYIIYFLSFYLIYKIVKIFKVDYWAIFILLYIGVSSMFNNQLNIVRQCFGIYLGTYAAIQIYRNNTFIALLLILIASLFHVSSLLFVIFFVLRKKIATPISPLILVIFLCTGSVIGFGLSTDILEVFIDYLPPAYAWHIKGGAVENVGLVVKITKYMYIPLYILSILRLKKFKLSGLNLWLFNWGILGISFRFLMINFSIVNRISLIFLIIGIFPIFFYLVWLKQQSKYLMFSIIVFGIILFYGLKVLAFPVNEYAYDSIFLQIF